MPRAAKRKAAAVKGGDCAIPDPSKMTVAQLKQECTKLGLGTAGTKAVLLKRLQDHAGAAGGKKVKTEDAPTTAKAAAETLKKAASPTKKVYKVDSYCPLSGSAEVHDDYDCMLNQTNIGHNNNKYYVIQLIRTSGASRYYVWNRWGRVGEPGQNALKGPWDIETAKKDFEKKFKDKTKNDWSKRGSFAPVTGKYTLLEMDTDDTEEDEQDTAEKIARLDELDGVVRKVLPSSLNSPTQSLMKLIFDNDMFKEQMAKMEIDVRKMPLGKLSKAQIAKGFEVLDEIEEELKMSRTSRLTELSSRFYTVIPHDFGRRVPPVINDQEKLRKKMDMLLVLGDIEIAQAMQKDKDKDDGSEATDIKHPLDVNYDLLNCGLELVKPSSEEFKVIEKYTEATKYSGWRDPKILNVWKVDRGGEGDRFKEHDRLENRKLLWHGTNVAVVAAILKTGLRIMPHSGGRVGRGIYFASENSKSAAYVGCASDNVGIMFLNEVALGKEKRITRDDSSLTKAPAGFDSVVAVGRREPDPKKNTSMKLEGKTVVVPQGQPINQKEGQSSSFGQTEYLVYKENQCRIRYLLKMKFGS
ncbi:protein mono-ADP-ribosyltransferase PARP3-like isoform X1 [Branchiostoma lanceolatum]|uniref:protein mono-ADP-ribosyltransferase PARP3-like isoform X1 n=1 Tax=Branchiostoma lanceolatum TaxID=7740 RepID=UPI0034559CBA